MAIGIPLGVAWLVAIAPVLAHGRFAAENDSLLYCALAEWYEDHPFSEAPSGREDQPIAHYAAIYHEAGYPMAPALLLSAAATAVRAPSPLLVYPAWSASGLVLALGLLLTAGRRVLRWPVRFVGAAGLGLAALIQPMTWAHHLGFLAQTFAVGLVLAALLHLSGLRSVSRLGFPDALQAALLAASLAVTYPPFLVLLAGGFAVWLRLGLRLPGARSARRAGFAGSVALLFAVLLAAEGLDLVRAFRFLGGTQVGGHVDLSPWGFVEATLGAWFWSPFGLGALGEGLRRVQTFLSPLYVFLAWRGLRHAARERAGAFGPFLGAMAVLGVGFVWFGAFTTDPWTGARGHTWNLFKLTQWAFPFAALAVLHGVATSSRGPWRLLQRAVALVPLLLLPLHLAFADRLGRDLEGFVGSARPLASWEAMRARFREKPREFVAADLPAASTPFLPTYLGLLAYPSPVVGDWRDALWIPPDPRGSANRLLEALAHGEPTDRGVPVTVVVTGLRGYRTDAVETVGGAIGFVREPGPLPQVLAVLSASDEAAGPGGCRAALAPRTRVLLWAPRAAAGRLRLVTDGGIVERAVTLVRGTSRLAIDLQAARTDRDRGPCLRSIAFEADATDAAGSDQNAPPLTSSFGSQGASGPPR